MERSSIATLATLFLVASGAPGAIAASARCDARHATVVGTSGDDYLVGMASDDVIVGRGGDDYIDGKGEEDLICGGRGDDSLLGGQGDDRILGESGDDGFIAGEDLGNDSYDGGGGEDFLLLSQVGWADGSSHVVGPARVDLAAGFSRVKGAGRDTLVVGSIENAFGRNGGDVIKGDDRDNYLSSTGGGKLVGGKGNDALSGGEDGGTTFRGGKGNDLIGLVSGTNDVFGGPGIDEFSFCGRGSSTGLDGYIDLAEGRASTFIGEDEDAVAMLDSIEKASGCFGDDTLKGDGGPNQLSGGRGDDVIEGRAGDDILIGGRNDDSGDGGEGTDTCKGVESWINCEP